MHLGKISPFIHCTHSLVELFLLVFIQVVHEWFLSLSLPFREASQLDRDDMGWKTHIRCIACVCKKLGHYFLIVVGGQLACNICMWIYLVHNYIAILAFWCIRFTTLINAILVKVCKNDGLRFCLTCLDEKLKLGSWKLNISKIGDWGWAALGSKGWKSNIFGELNHCIETWTLKPTN